MEKSADAFRTISEVADDLDIPQHVLRFWETRFPQIRPLKRAGGRRYYRPADVGLLKTIRQLLYSDGYTIKGVQRLLKEQGARGLLVDAPSEAQPERSGQEPCVAVDHWENKEKTIAHPGASTEPVETVDDASLSFRKSAASGRSALEGAHMLREVLDTVEECRRILADAER